MKMTKIYPVGKFKIIQIVGAIDGKPTARCVPPWDEKTGEKTDVSGEVKQIKDACTAAWTPEVIAAYKARMEAAI